MSLIKTKNYFYDVLDNDLRILIYQFENYSSDNYKNVLNEYDYYYNHLLESFKNNMNDYTRNLNINDKFFMKTIIKLDGNNLRHASKRLRSNLDLIIPALQKNGESLKYVSYKIKEKLSNYYLNKMAIDNNPNAIKYSSYKIRCDKNLVLRCMNILNSFDIYKYLPSHLKEDIEIINVVLSTNTNFYCRLPYKILKRRQVILVALNKNPWLFQFIPEGFKSDKGILNLVLKKNY